MIKFRLTEIEIDPLVIAITLTVADPMTAQSRAPDLVAMRSMSIDQMIVGMKMAMNTAWKSILEIIGFTQIRHIPERVDCGRWIVLKGPDIDVLLISQA